MKDKKTSWSKEEVIALIEKHSDYIDSIIDHEAINAACCSIPSPSWNDDEWISENIC